MCALLCFLRCWCCHTAVLLFQLLSRGWSETRAAWSGGPCSPSETSLLWCSHAQAISHTAMAGQCWGRARRRGGLNYWGSINTWLNQEFSSASPSEEVPGKKPHCWALACGVVSRGGLMQVKLGSCVQEKLPGEPTHPGPKLFSLNPCALVSIWDYSNGRGNTVISAAGDSCWYC